jgi:hypothetical protein
MRVFDLPTTLPMGIMRRAVPRAVAAGLPVLAHARHRSKLNQG